jgi:hypothetical protein
MPIKSAEQSRASSDARRNHPLADNTWSTEPLLSVGYLEFRAHFSPNRTQGSIIHNVHEVILYGRADCLSRTMQYLWGTAGTLEHEPGIVELRKTWGFIHLSRTKAIVGSGRLDPSGLGSQPSGLRS